MVPTTTLQFQDHAIDVFDRDGVRWIGSAQIGPALGFTGNASRHVRKIFERHRAEFTDDMTALVSVDLPMGGRQDMRMFSPRGAKLIAMLAKTERSAAFRVWVLDVLEGLADASARPALDTITVPKDRYIELLEAENALLRGGRRRRRKATVPLTEKERLEIVRLGRTGLSNGEIGRQVGRSPSIVSVVRKTLIVSAEA